MKISTFLRHIREGFKNVLRNGWMSFASISAIAISLFILGVFILLTINVNKFADQVEDQVEIRTYLQVDTPQSLVSQLHNDIALMSEVNKVTFVSKAEALEILRKKLGKDGESYLRGYDKPESNPLPDSFTVEVKEPREVAFVAKKIEEMNNNYAEKPIYKVNYGKGTVDKLFSITKAVRNIGLVIVAGLAITAMFLIANTIKLTIIARRREISIMKLVGATNSFIRWPFFIEGTIIGVVGSVIPLVVLLFSYNKMVEGFRLDLASMLVTMADMNDVTSILTVALFSIGIVIGVWGSVISVRKYLKV